MTDRQAEYEARRALEADRKTRRKGRARSPNNAAAKHARKQPCRLCLTPHRSEAHHIVPRSKFHREGSDVINHPHNLLPLCHACHQGHHTTTHGRIPRHLLSDDQIAFALEHTSENWLGMWYPVR